MQTGKKAKKRTVIMMHRETGALFMLRNEDKLNSL